MTTVCERIFWVFPEWMKTRPQCRLSDKCLFAFYIAFLALMISALVSFICIGTLWLKVANENHSIKGYMKPQCADDGFKTVTFVVEDRYENKIPKHVKIFASNDGEAGSYSMTFVQAEDMCKQLNSTLWEVSCEEEWIAVTNALNKMAINASVWLNGRVKSNVNKECEKTEALTGKGVPVEWKTDKRVAEYSRLVKGETEDKKCIFVQDVDSMLWNVDKCEISQHVLLCVKNDCFVQ